MPEVEVYAALSGAEKWDGTGELAVPLLGGAVANAIYFATGKRMYSSPIKNHDLSWS
jgi:isoquinoline 1-oxidoreductase beta subunit